MSVEAYAEIDGVPVLFAAAAGPMRAGLVFRVGRVDETLATGGLTHLVEHLALHRTGVADFHYNGMTSTTTTHFVSQGSPESITKFIGDVCASLRDLPVDRVEQEKRILLTEAAGRSYPVNMQAPLWRHGARDFGLPSYPEWGLHKIRTRDVTEWAATWFTRGNAVLWIAGDHLPDGLEIDLPDGPRQPLPAESSAVPVLPAYYTTDEPTVVADGRVPRTQPASAFARILDRALFRELRQVRGLSYTATAGYATDGRTDAMVTAFADSQAGRAGEVLEVFLAELRRLVDTDIHEAELETVRALMVQELAAPEVDARLLPRRATDLLTGFAARTTEQMRAGFERTSAADVRDVARTFLQSALLMVPSGVRSVPGFEAAPTMSRFAVTGRRHKSLVGPQSSLVVGPEGVSITSPQGAATVRYADTAVLLRWPDGARQLIGTDAISVRFEPELFHRSAAVSAEIDEAVPSSVTVDLPARDAAHVPKRAGRLALARRRVRAWWLPVRARMQRDEGKRRWWRPRPEMIGVLVTVAVLVACALGSGMHFLLIYPVFAGVAASLALRRSRR